jgi:hypothetical protein
MFADAWKVPAPIIIGHLKATEITENLLILLYFYVLEEDHSNGSEKPVMITVNNNMV